MTKAKEATVADYKYIDAYHCDENGKSSPWRRIEMADLQRYQQEEAYNFNCFATVQRYLNKARVKGEAYIAPLLRPRQCR